MVLDKKEYFQNSEALKQCLSEQKTTKTYTCKNIQIYKNIFFYFGVEMVWTDPVCFKRYR